MIRIIISILLAVTVVNKLVYLSELFRHGARYPVNDFYDGKETKPFHGQLTGVGMRQQYLLGSYLRQDYLQALGLSSSFDSTQAEIFVDGSQRCIQSAYAHMAGWFPLGQGQQIPSGLDPSLLEPPFATSNNLNKAQTIEEPALTGGYQPIPVKIEKNFFPSCPKEDQLFAKRAQVIAARLALLEIEQTALVGKLKKIFNLTTVQANLAGLLQLYDTIVCDKNLGRPLPPAFTDKQFYQMKYVQNYVFVLLYAEHLAKVYSTPIIHSIIDKMTMVVNNQYGNKKLTVYSAHDTNVAPMLTFLNLTSAQCVQKKYRNQTVVGNCAEPVPFASSIQWQLHIRQSQQLVVDPVDASNYYVKIKYNGQYYQLCQNQSFECDFTEFSNRIKDSMVDYNKECGIKQ